MEQLTLENSTKKERLEKEIKDLQARIDSLTSTLKKKQKALKRLEKEEQKVTSEESINSKILQENENLKNQLNLLVNGLFTEGFLTEELVKKFQLNGIPVETLNSSQEEKDSSANPNSEKEE